MKHVTPPTAPSRCSDWCADRLESLLPVHRWLADTSHDVPIHQSHRAEEDLMATTDESVFWELIEELQFEDPRVE